MPADAFSDSFPDEEELASIGQLKDQFRDKLEERERRGLLVSALFGDLALTRVLRQNKHDLEKSSAWFRNFLETFAELDGDQVVPELVRKVEAIEKEGRRIQNEDIPGHAKAKSYCSILYNAEGLSKNGNPLSYFPLAELNKHAIVNDNMFEEYERYVFVGWLMRAVELDMMSQKQGRLCKVINVIDVAGCSVSQLMCKGFDSRAEKMMQRLERLLPDLTGGNWVINVPWILEKLFPWAKRTLKVKVDNWYLCSGDGQQDPALLEIVSTDQLEQLQTFRRSAHEESEKASAGEHVIGRSAVHEHAIEVAAGQQVSWTFSVSPGGLLLPPAEVDFGVTVIWEIPEDDESSLSQAIENACKPIERHKQKRVEAKTDRQSQGMVLEDGGVIDLVRGDDSDDEGLEYSGLKEEAVAEVTRHRAGEPESHGSYTAPQKGLLILRWSNEFNPLRTKRIRFSVESAQT